jgi:DNA-binding CsgD family transcriptional regulator
MKKTKKTQKPKSYWEMLIKEVTDEDTQKRCDSDQGVTYELPSEPRHSKYTLGEPMNSVYFTQREAECVMQIMKGKTLHETGQNLSLSPRTVEYYLNKIKRKLHCRKKREIIQLVATTDFVKNFSKNPYNNTREEIYNVDEE